MTPSILITQCIQRDFISPVTAQAPLPNRLHVGREEARRLLGDDPARGPLAQLMAWARAQAPEALEIIHIRDRHDGAEPSQLSHLEQFGEHCLRGTPGAQLVLDLEADLEGRSNETLVDASGLNDFEHTRLGALLEELAGSAEGPLRVGVVGVWTEAKVSFLLYDLKTRCGLEQLGTCSALTASRSRTQHFNALGQLERILGVEVFESLGEFTEWLVPGGRSAPLPSPASGDRDRARITLEVDQGASPLDEVDRDLLGFLFRESAEVNLRSLSGGFSGARVFRANSVDPFGQSQAPAVVKLGPRALIAKERVAFERVEEVLGNDAPRLRAFADLGERAGLKFSYAAMGQGGVQTLKSLFEQDAPEDQIEDILRTVFEEILGRFYAAARSEPLSLLDHYGFSSRFAPHVRERVKDLLGEEAAARDQLIIAGRQLRNLVRFYEELDELGGGGPGERHQVSFIHGDLNGANILVDGRNNVWLIDFFHTGRGHVLRDLAKLENDLLYIFTPLRDEAELDEALRITEALLAVRDLRAPLPERLAGLEGPQLRRAWRFVRQLRAVGGRLCGTDRSAVQLSLALLRYGAHTLAFDESSTLQKRWALASACGQAELIRADRAQTRLLRVDWVELPSAPGGKLGVTICPGRRDRGRDLEADLDVIVESADALYCLATADELEWAGVSHLRGAAEARGLDFHHLPVPDQQAPSLTEATEAVSTILSRLARADTIVLHCMGGLGRSGTLAACVVCALGASADEALAAVRRARGPRAVESKAQERFLRLFEADRNR